MECKPCGNEIESELLSHLAETHPDLDQVKALGEMGLKPVTVAMHHANEVCDSCDSRFLVGQFYGEKLEDMLFNTAIASQVCSECFCAR